MKTDWADRWIALVGLVAAVATALPLGVAAQVATPVAATDRLHRLDPQTSQGMFELFKYSGASVPFVSAHRGGGAQPHFPENCLATFEATLRQSFALLEIDPRYSKDGIIMVHHDETLDRTTTGKGRIADFTLAELKRLRLKDSAGNVTAFPIPTLDEVFEWARGKTILVIDQKDVPVTARARKIEEHRAESYAMLIVSSFKDVQACYALNTNILMEVMMPSRDKVLEFDKLGVPWRNVIAFVGHVPPLDAGLYEMIHQRGSLCMVGSSRNLDRKLLTRQVEEIKALEPEYRALLQRGADLIETDIPRQLGPLLYHKAVVPSSLKKYFHAP